MANDIAIDEKNLIEDCNYGMTFGHSDSDNLIRDNDIRRSGEAGIHFRGGSKAFAPHRNRFERNRIVDSGAESAPERSSRAFAATSRSWDRFPPTGHRLTPGCS